jgi:sortase A
MTSVIDRPRRPSPPPGASAQGTDQRALFVLRGIGQTLVTLGCVVALFVVYEVWITNLFADRNNRHNISVLKQEWMSGDDPLLPLPGQQRSGHIPVGKGIGILYIPRFGIDYHEAIIEGDPTPSRDQLSQGVPHYGSTAVPGQVGNFAVAGHRVGHGSPFLNLDHLRAGDAVVVETKSFWYVYRVKGTPWGSDPADSRDADGLPGREIVGWNDGDVLLPHPDHPGMIATEALMTMTTCHPKFLSTHRMVIYSLLQTKVPSTGIAMPAAITALYSQARS